jgi:hypothetical protein
VGLKRIRDAGDRRNHESEIEARRHEAASNFASFSEVKNSNPN